MLQPSYPPPHLPLHHRPWLRRVLLCVLLLYAVAATVWMIRQDACMLQLSSRLSGHPQWLGMIVSIGLEGAHLLLLGLLAYRLLRGAFPVALERARRTFPRSLNGKSLALALVFTLLATEPFGAAAVGLGQQFWQQLGLQPHMCKL